MKDSVIIFPGQGSQSVAMGKDLYDNFVCAKRVFQELDDALNQNLSDIIFNGPIETLTLTANVQPAIMSVSIALMKVIEELSGKTIFDFTDYVAGHSLGEYTALCAIDALSLTDTAKLLRVRGDAMQNAVPNGLGAMAVVLGLSIDDVKQVCLEASNLGCCDLANDNAPGQVVISGNKIAIEKAMEIVKNMGAKRAMLLPLSVPPHSSLMMSAKEKMQEALSNIKFNELKIPLISNRTVKPVQNISEVKELLIQQIVNGVRWRETILSLPSLGISKTIEIGPGRVLTGLTPRIVPEMTAVSINNLNDIQSFINNNQKEN